MGKFNSVPPNATVYQGELAGGATDIRLQGGEFYDFNSLKSRIMVAASGGSREHHLSTLSPAGGLFSIESNTSDRYNNNFLFTLYGANQTHPGFSSDIRGISGTFGIAGYIVDPTQDWGAISGNGYYAGCSSSSYGGSTGGSSFITVNYHFSIQK